MALVDRHDPSKRSLRVLIIDGHDISRAACAALLRTEGLDVVDIRPGRNALAVARSLQPHVVLIDRPPGADGVEMLARALHTLRRAPAVVLTSRRVWRNDWRNSPRDFDGSRR